MQTVRTISTIPPSPAGPCRRVGPLLAAAILAGAALAVVWWIDPRDVAVPLCLFHRLTGLCCPGCGATRATHELLHGRLLSALNDNALWTVSLPLVVYAAAARLRRAVREGPLPEHRAGRPWPWIAVAVVVLLFGVLRNVPLYPLSLLAPPG